MHGYRLSVVGLALVLAQSLVDSPMVQAAQMEHGQHGKGHDAASEMVQPAQPLDSATTAVEFEMMPTSGNELVAGEEVHTIVRITDTITGKPVTGRQVAGWMMLQRNSQVAAELSCKAKTTLFSQGRLTTRPDVDLNVSKMMILYRDGSIGIANPQVDFTITQLEKVIPLPGVPADWVMTADGQMVFVSLPLYGAIAVINTRSLQIVQLLEMGKGSLPTQLAGLPDGRVAVFLSGSQSIAIADATGIIGQPVSSGSAHDAKPTTGHDGVHDSGSHAVRSVKIGEGPVAMDTTADGVLFAASADGNVIAIDTATLTLLADARIPAGEPGIALAEKDNHLYVSSLGTSRINVFDPKTLEAREPVAVDNSIFSLAMDPQGHFLLALNRVDSKLVLIDPRNNRIVDQQPVAKSPVEIAFTHQYAYVRGLEGDHFSVVELAELRNGHIVPVNIQSASRPMIKREALSRARLVAPYGHGTLVANADEAVAYYYMEGMNSAMGTLKTYGQNIQGLMTIDRGFREFEPGVYETTTVLPHGGKYDVPILVGSDELIQCFSITADNSAVHESQHAGPSIRIEANGKTETNAQHGDTFVFRITDSKTGEPATGLADVRLLAFSSSGAWQARQWATELGNGRYAGEWTFPKQGRYGLAIEVASRDFEFADQAPLYLKVLAPEDSITPDSQSRSAQ